MRLVIGRAGGGNWGSGTASQATGAGNREQVVGTSGWNGVGEERNKLWEWGLDKRGEGRGSYGQGHITTE